jgi:hypothetical protein
MSFKYFYIMCAAGNLTATVSDSEWAENGKSLLCTLYPEPVTDCRFTRPDGRVILPKEGIGNAEYSHFGDGSLRGDCGLTIHDVQETDKGMWNCTVSDGSTQRSGFRNVSTNGKYCFFLITNFVQIYEFELQNLQK